MITRNSRAERYADEANNASSREELEEIAERWEFSLMLRLIGPHQGIRLERMRAELDDTFELALNETIEQKVLPDIDQTNLVETIGPSKHIDGTIDSDGYHWLSHDDVQYYRSSSDDEWIEWSN